MIECVSDEQRNNFLIESQAKIIDPVCEETECDIKALKSLFKMFHEFILSFPIEMYFRYDISAKKVYRDTQSDLIYCYVTHKFNPNINYLFHIDHSGIFLKYPGDTQITANNKNKYIEEMVKRE